MSQDQDQNQWETSLEGGWAVITLTGGTGISSTGGLSQAVSAALAAGAAEVIVDVTRARRCSLAGIAALARARHHAEAGGAVLRILAGRAVRQAMTPTGPVTRGLLPQPTIPAAVADPPGSDRR